MAALVMDRSAPATRRISLAPLLVVGKVMLRFTRGTAPVLAPAPSTAVALLVSATPLVADKLVAALLTEEGFEKEEFLPYWAELWASGVALAHDVARVVPLGHRGPPSRPATKSLASPAATA